MKNTQNLELIMNEFSTRTGLIDESQQSRRYLWTDAFAVCNFLQLYNQTKNEDYKEMSLALVDAVHSCLGSYHNKDSRKGWISGSDDAKEHPTVGGLRIGKSLLDRAEDEPYDEKKEWDRDGQYFHYLTKWMHALNQVAIMTKDAKYIRWAIELAKTAHKAFTYDTSGGVKRMYWKMSTDLTRPLVTSMGQHDALETYITYQQLAITASELGENISLSKEIEEAAAMTALMPLETQDSLGIGSLLSDASRVGQLIAIHGLALEELLISLLDAAYKGIRYFIHNRTLEYPAEYRLAFRELGLSIGLHGLEMLQKLLEEHINKFKEKEAINETLLELQKYIPLAEAIETFWMLEEHQENLTWKEHIDINSTMLATSLAPEGFLRIT